MPAMSRLATDHHLYEPAKDGHPPVWWVRGLLVPTCTGVSLSHGSNDGQKSIGLIMLTIIGLLPAVFGLNPEDGMEVVVSMHETTPVGIEIPKSVMSEVNSSSFDGE